MIQHVYANIIIWYEFLMILHVKHAILIVSVVIKQLQIAVNVDKMLI